MITRIQRFSIPVSDQERAKEFYVGRLGLVLSEPGPAGA